MTHEPAKPRMKKEKPKSTKNAKTQQFEIHNIHKSKETNAWGNFQAAVRRARDAAVRDDAVCDAAVYAG